MGFSFSGLSLVPSATAELDSNVSVQQRNGGAKQHREVFPANGKQAASRKGGLADSESDWQFALYASVDGQPSQVKDTPPQASPFSAAWTSAIGAGDSQDSSATPDPLSVPVSKESVVSEGASHERLADLLAVIRGESRATAVLTLPSSAAHLEGAPVSGWNQGIDSADLKAMLQATRMRASANSVAIDAPLGASPTHPEAANEAWLISGDAQSNAETALLNGAGNRIAASLDAALTSGSGLAQALANGETPAENDARDLAPSANETPDSSLLADGRHAGYRGFSGEQNGKIAPESAAADPGSTAGQQQTAAGSTANPYAVAAETANNATPEMAARDAAANMPRPHANAGTPQQNGSGAGAPTAATGGSQPSHTSSEIAFQGELRLRSSEGSTTTAETTSQPANPPQGNLGRLTAPAIRDAGTAGSDSSQSVEPKASPEGMEENPRDLFRRGANLSAGGGDSFSGQDHSGSGFDRGTQTTPLAQGAGGAQPVPSSTTAPKQATIPAAAQLDGFAPTTTDEILQPARAVELKIQTGDRGAANVVLTDRGGQVHMTVRSSDPALAQSLRSDLGSLAGGLHQQGFDVKLWNPSSGSSTADDSRADTLELSQDDMRGHNRNRHTPDDAQRDRRQNQWPEEID